MALRELLLKLGIEVDKNGEQAALTGLDKIKAAAGVVAGAFAAIKTTQFVTDMANEVRTLADEIDKTSQQLGLTPQSLEEFRHAANLAGVDGRALSDTFGKLQKNAFEAANGNVKYAEDFARLGVSVTDATGRLKSADELITEMADGFSGLDNSSEKVALSLNLMGRAGRKLLPLLNQGSKAIAEQREEARKLGGVFGDELIGMSVQLTDDQARLGFALRGLKSIVAAEVMPTMIELAQRSIEIAVIMRGPLTRAVRFLGRLFSGVSMAVDFLNSKLEYLGTVLFVLTGGVGILGLAFLLAGKTATLAAFKVAAAWVIANAPLFLMIGLLGIIIAAIALFVEDVVGMGDGSESVFGTLITGFQDLLEEVGGWGAAIKEIFFNVIQYWLGVTREGFDNFIELLSSPLDAVEERFKKIAKRFGGGIKAFFGFGGAENVAGVSAASATPSNVSGGNSVVNQPRTSIEVSVDAKGRGDADEVGSAVAREVDAALSRRDRQTMQAFTQAVEGGT